MHKKIGLSFSFGAVSGSGEGAAEFSRCLEQLQEPLEEASNWIRENAKKTEPGFGWYDLPEAAAGESLAVAEWLKDYDAIIHVGIGGSSLGNLMLNQALLPLYYNELSSEKRGPRFYLADNPDPVKTRAILERVRGERVALIGVSKSGATAETMSQFLWFLSELGQVSPFNAKEDVLVITDPKSGVFRAFAAEVGCRSLELPASVGGRYSVLSPSGLAPLAALGGDAESLLAGARDMKEALEATRSLTENPARFFAAASRIHERSGRPMTVLMPYSSRLETFSEWFAQLWGESIGKDGAGTTPIRALGAIDQHSQVQLYCEGPDDKFYTLIGLTTNEADIILPETEQPSLASLSYIGSKSLAHMLDCEAKSTAAALVKAGRPLLWIEAQRLDAHTLGALIFFYEYATALTCRIMGINPFDQPGVEQGKRYTYGMMGRKSFEEDAKEADLFFSRVQGSNIAL